MNKAWWKYKEDKYKKLIKQKEASLQIHIRELDRLRAENVKLVDELNLTVIVDGNFTKDELISFARYVWYEKPFFKTKPNEGILTYFDEWKGINKQLLIMTPQEKADELKRKSADTMLDNGMRICKTDALAVASLIASEIMKWDRKDNKKFWDEVIEILSE